MKFIIDVIRYDLGAVVVAVAILALLLNLRTVLLFLMAL